MRHGVLVVSDEIHDDLIYEGYQHVPFGSISEAFANKSITAIAPSAGLQTSVLIIADEQYRERVNKTMSSHFVFGPNAFGVVACEYAYRYGGPWVDALMDYLIKGI